MEDHNKYQSHCHGTQCDSIGLTARNAARSEAHDFEAAAGLGGAVLVAGAVLVLSSPRPRFVLNNAAKLEVTPIAGWDRAGVALSGAW
jgi:hypothetical protein